MITLSTILYEKNYKNFFNEENFFWKFNSKYITSKILIINNIDSVEEFNEKINEWKKKFSFDIFFVSEYEEESIKHFNLNINKNQVGYLYSIPYYVMSNVCNTKYLLNIATDCTKNITLNDDFFGHKVCLLLRIK